MIRMLVLCVLFSMPLMAETRYQGDIVKLTEVVYFEARDQPLIGQVAVIQNILHRLEDDCFPDSIQKIVEFKRKKKNKFVCAYSYFCDGKSDAMLNEEAKQTAEAIVVDVLNGKYPDLIDGADHYFNPNLVLPSWAKKMVRTVQIEDHVYYREDRVCS